VDEARSTVLREAAERAVRYLDVLDQRHVQPKPADVDRLELLGGPFPDSPMDAAEVLALLDDVGSPAAMGTAGPRFFGFVIGGALPATVAASWLGTAWDQNAAMAVASPVATALEQVALEWLLEVLRLPPGSAGGFVTGATMANLTALAAARDAVLARVGWDSEADGLFGAPPITVVLGEEAHPSVVKALGLLGLGRDRVLLVPTDGQGRMRADQLPDIAAPAIICLQAGNVNTGAVDPISPILAWAGQAGAWVHVDGAFGLWARAAPGRAHLVDGVEAADSWATDAHKWLNTPYDSGIAIVRDPDQLRRAMAMSAAYLPAGELREPSHFVPELSRRARGVEIWAALRALGRQGVADLVERTCRHAERFAVGLRAAGFEVLNDVVLNQVLVHFRDDETTRRVVVAVQEDGTCWCGPTVWQGRTAMRISVSSWATRTEDVDRSLQAIVEAAHSVRAAV
jgi:glutamate/tyrosine decarboxylase-like PLP-dependent enzyme